MLNDFFKVTKSLSRVFFLIYQYSVTYKQAKQLQVCDKFPWELRKGKVWSQDNTIWWLPTLAFSDQRTLLTPSNGNTLHGASLLPNSVIYLVRKDAVLSPSLAQTLDDKTNTHLNQGLPAPQPFAGCVVVGVGLGGVGWGGVGLLECKPATGPIEGQG